MSTIDDYLSSVGAVERGEFERIRGIVRRVVPSIEEGASYGMPAYLFRGKPLLSALAHEKFLSLYPFSGKVVEKLRETLSGFECTSGSIHFSVGRPIPTEVLEAVIACRLEEIEAAAGHHHRETPSPHPACGEGEETERGGRASVCGRSR